MADYENEDEVKIETEPKNSDFAEEHEGQPPVWYNGCYATKRPPTLHNVIKSSTQGARSKTRCAISSSTIKVARTLFLV